MFQFTLRNYLEFEFCMRNLELYGGMQNPFQYDMNHYLFAVLGPRLVFWSVLTDSQITIVW